MEKDSVVKHAQAWAWQGWVTPKEKGCQGEKNSRVKGDLLDGKKRLLIPAGHQFG